jgi:hypothetical protein
MSHGGAVAAVGLVHDDAHAWIGVREILGQLPRCVGTAVVDHDHLVCVGNKLARRHRLVDGALDVLGLVVAGQDDRQAAETPDDVLGSFCGSGDGGGASHGSQHRGRS